MGTTLTKLDIDTPEKIFSILKTDFGDSEGVKKVTTNMNTYSVVDLTIPNGPSAVACCIGFRKKRNEEDGQMFCVWAHTPMGTKSTDEINIFDSEPFLIIETFKNSSIKGVHELQINYKVGTITTGVFRAFLLVVDIVKEALSTISK